MNEWKKKEWKKKDIWRRRKGQSSHKKDNNKKADTSTWSDGDTVDHAAEMAAKEIEKIFSNYPLQMTKSDKNRVTSLAQEMAEMIFTIGL